VVDSSQCVHLALNSAFPSPHLQGEVFLGLQLLRNILYQPLALSEKKMGSPNAFKFKVKTPTTIKELK
jgi:hypothetical protein